MRGLYLLSLLGLLLPGISTAEIQPRSIVISEIQTGSQTSASQEFIEIYNASDEAIDISAYQLEYYSAVTTVFTAPTRTITLHGILGAGKYYLIASNDYLTELAEDHFSATLAKTGGHIRLVSPDLLAAGQFITHDLVGWGTAASPEGSAAGAPNGGESLQRKTDISGPFIDTNDNASDFALNAAPTPQSNPEAEDSTEPSPEEPPIVEESPADVEETHESTAPTNLTSEESSPLLPPQITELLPNPASPQTDAEGEFVELYNPNPEPIDLNGYKLQTGSSYSYSFTFDEEVLAPGEYKAFYVSDTNTLLANSGGRARLINPDGEVVSETSSYEEAEDGEAWALINSTWQWTSTPTTDAANVLTLPPAANKAGGEATKKTKAKKSKKTSAKKAATKKQTKKSKPAATGNERAIYNEPEPTPPPLHPGVLAGIGGLTLAYGGYEYKNDVANRFRQLRRYRASRRKYRQTP